MSASSNRLFSAEAEIAVLSAIICDPTLLGWLDLSDDHFSLSLHRHVFRAMVGLYDSDKPLDEITVLDACLAETPTLSPSDVSKLVIASPAADNAEHWVDILEEHRRIRVIADTVGKANEYLAGSRIGDSGEIQDGILESLEQINKSSKSGSVTMDESCQSEVQRMEVQWAGGASPRMQTGILSVDLGTGGLPVGVPAALGARPGVGKSMVLWNICNNIAGRGEHVLVMTNEDRPDVSSRLAIANCSGIERRRLLAGNLSEIEKEIVRGSVEKMGKTNSCYHFIRIHGKKMTEICREATAIVRRHSVKLVALDYIQNVPSVNPTMNRNYGIEENMTTLEAMVSNEDISCIVVGQIKRIQDRRPTMQDFKDSGSIEQKCKLMMILTDGEVDGILDVDVVKNSEGRMGDVIHLDVDKGLGRIT